MTATVAGFDYDSNGIFCVLVDEETGTWSGTIVCDLACGPGDAVRRAQRVRDLMPARGAWVDSGVVAIGIESTFSQNFKATASLARVQGAIVACLPRDLPIRLLTANGRQTPGWKILTVGQTNATKPDVKAWAIDHGAPPGLVQDQYDAFAIARATRRIHLGQT